MSRFRTLLFFLALTAVAFIPHMSFAAVGTFTGPILSPSVSDTNGNIQTCAAGWKGLISVIGTLLQFAIYLGVIICVLTIAYAGFLWVLNPLSPENRSSAKNVLQNSVIGLLLILCSWLIVNTILSAISTGGISVQTAVFGTGGDVCIKPIPQSTISNGGTGSPGTGGGTGSSTPTQPSGPAPEGTGDCAPTSPSMTSWGAQADTMSCIANDESGCQDSAKNAGSSATGRYQILIGLNDTGHNLNFSSCTSAAQSAGYSYSGNLNCSKAYKGATIIDSNLANACTAAGDNVQCNTDAAQWLYHQAGYSPWISGDTYGRNAACVQKYANGGSS